MNLISNFRDDPDFLQALEDAMYITSPSLNLSGGFSGKNSIVLSKKSLPKEITSAKILLVEKTTMLLSCNLKKQHAPFQVRLYIRFSYDFSKHFTPNKDAKNLGYAHLYVREIEKNEPIVSISLGDFKEDYKAKKFALADAFDFEQTKLVTIPTKVKK
jgi:hypothetical protein